MQQFTVPITLALFMAIPMSAAPPTTDSHEIKDVLTDQVLIYRGELWYRNAPVERPVDLEFRVFAGEMDVVPLAPMILAEQWPVEDGRVLVELDFGDPALFMEGAWLEVTVDGTILSPRQFIPPAGMTLFASDISTKRRAPAASAEDSLFDDHAPDDSADADAKDTSSDAIHSGRSRGAAASGSGLSHASSRTVAAGRRGDDAGRPQGGRESSDANPPESPQEINLASGAGWTTVGSNIVWTNRKVGIGLSNPAYKLDIRASNVNTIVRVRNNRPTGLSRGLWSETSSSSSRAIEGLASATSGATVGVYGQSNSPAGYGVSGVHQATSGATAGVHGATNSTAASALGVHGVVVPTSPGGFSTAVRGQNNGTGTLGIGVWGSQNGSGWGVYGTTPNGIGVYGVASSATAINYGVYGQTNSPTGYGVYGTHLASTGTTPGVYGATSSTAGNAIGVHGVVVPTGPGGFSAALRGQNNGTGGNGIGVWGSQNGSGWGVYGTAVSGIAIYGVASANSGVNYGVYGQSNSTSGFDFFAGGAGTNYGSPSSIRWKRNIEQIDEPLYKLAQLRGVYFDWDKEHGGQRDLGMIAEEVGKVLPEIVQYEENKIDAIGMDYSKLTPLLVEALKALRAEKDSEIAKHASRLTELESENAELRERIARLEALISQLVR